ncbi:reverse transcriptase domain-containing protein, partial [Tanacetum coccineum]
LDFRESSKKTRRAKDDSLSSSYGSLPARYRHMLEKSKTHGRGRNNDKSMFNRLGHRKKSVLERLSDAYYPSTTKSGPSRESSRDHSHGRGCPRSRDRPSSRNRSRSKTASVASKNRMAILTPPAGQELSIEIAPTTRTALTVERWAMPTWWHMFNSTLIGDVRVWFDELPPKSIDGYKGLKAAFLAYFMKQKKYVKDPVEIYSIKQRDGETIEEFMERFKIETGRMKGAL